MLRLTAPRGGADVRRADTGGSFMIGVRRPPHYCARQTLICVLTTVIVFYPVSSICIRAAVCDLALAFGEGQDGDRDKRMSRPFGVALLLAGYDELDGPQLFFSDPSGTFVRYKAKAIGAGSEGAQTNLQESYNEDMTLEEAEELALGTLKQVMEEKINTDNVELARVVPGKGFHIATTEEVGAVLERLS
jgi:20S proteasome subunit alpha 5